MPLGRLGRRTKGREPELEEQGQEKKQKERGRRFGLSFVNRCESKSRTARKTQATRRKEVNDETNSPFHMKSVWAQ